MLEREFAYDAPGFRLRRLLFPGLTTNRNEPLWNEHETFIAASNDNRKTDELVDINANGDTFISLGESPRWRASLCLSYRLRGFLRRPSSLGMQTRLNLFSSH